MRSHLSRRHTLSLGFFGSLGVLGAWSCTGNVDETGTAGGAGGTSPDGGGSGGATGGSGGATGGSGGATGGAGGSGGATGGSGGSTGGTGGSTGGTGGSGGATGGAGGSGGATGGSGGATGGSAGTGGAGGSGGAGGANDAGAGCGMAMITGLISGNHGHTLVVPMADIMAGVDKVYNTRGTATHDHFVQVTAADFGTLRSGGTLTKRSCNSNDHEYVLSCGTPTRMPTAPPLPACNETECGATMTTLCPS